MDQVLRALGEIFSAIGMGVEGLFYVAEGATRRVINKKYLRRVVVLGIITIFVPLATLIVGVNGEPNEGMIVLAVFLFLALLGLWGIYLVPLVLFLGMGIEIKDLIKRITSRSPRVSAPAPTPAPVRSAPVPIKKKK